MSNWKNISINKNQVEHETGRAVLIKMPNNSQYSGFKFWHPAKCVRAGKHSAALSVGYTDEWEFDLFKNGNGKHNSFDKIDEVTISVEEFEEAFGVTNENISAPIVKDEDSYLKETVPAELEPVNAEVLDELAND